MGELVAVFAAGVASAASPCLLPLYPGFLAYLSANAGSLAGRRASGLLGLLVLAGLHDDHGPDRGAAARGRHPGRPRGVAPGPGHRRAA